MSDHEKNDQAKPLAPASARVIHIDDHQSSSPDFLKRRHGKCIKCCGCCTAVLLILVVTILILTFTVFRVRDPILNMNSVSIDGLDRFLQTGNISSQANFTTIAEMSIKNPNIASFHYRNTTTHVYYNGTDIGEAIIPEGRAMAHRTIRMNVSMVVLADRVVGVSRFTSDLVAGFFPISTYTRVSGNVRIMGSIRRSVVVRMNCTMNVNISSHGIQDQNCRKHVSL